MFCLYYHVNHLERIESEILRTQIVKSDEVTKSLWQFPFVLRFLSI
jgi:hypothetical protein